MAILFHLVLDLSAVVTIMTTPALSGHAEPAKEFIVDLDTDPQHRWSEIVAAYKQEIPMAMELLKHYIPSELLPILALLGDDLDTYIPYPYNQEILGMALQVGMPVGDVVLLNLLYDLTAGCTSIVAEDTNGLIYHVRNMDYHMTTLLRNVTIVVHYQSKGKTLYSSTTFAGYVGILTGQKPNMYTISLDERDAGEQWENLIEALLNHKAYFNSFLIRDVLASDYVFESAVKQLAYTPLIAPSYIIVGGAAPRQGVVITRDRMSALNIWELNAEENKWFLVETNYDHWTTPPPSDDRRDPAIKEMNELGRENLSAEGLFNVLSTPPVLNNGTVYTTLMSAGQPDIYKTYIRYP